MAELMATRPLDILLVEDNVADVRLTREALKESKLNSTLHVAQDGREAMAILQREGAYATAPRPRLILLDLNLPGRDGREILADLKNDEDLRRIPVVVLTTSHAEDDILKCYDLHANCYITKPFGMEAFTKVVLSIEHFWLSVATLPPE
jgi:chemotaxis family two-component system response regulator Rcp1